MKQLIYKRVFTVEFDDNGSPTEGSPLQLNPLKSGVMLPGEPKQAGRKPKKIRLKFFNDKIFKFYIQVMTMDLERDEGKKGKKKLAVIEEEDPADADEEQPQDTNLKNVIMNRKK